MIGVLGKAKMMISCLSLSVSKIPNDIIGNVIMHDSVTIKRAPVCSTS